MTRTLVLTACLGLVLLAPLPSRALDYQGLPAISADGQTVAFHEYFSDSMNMDSRVVFAKTGTHEGKTLHIICTECGGRDGPEIKMRLKRDGYKALEVTKLNRKKRIHHFELGGLSFTLARQRTGKKTRPTGQAYKITASKAGERLGTVTWRPDGDDPLVVALATASPVILYIQVELGPGTTWEAVKVTEDKPAD